MFHQGCIENIFAQISGCRLGLHFGSSDLLDSPLGFTQKCLPVEVVTLHQSNAPINSKLWSSPLPSGWKFDAKDITGLLEGLLFFFLNLNLRNLFLLLLLWYLLTVVLVAITFLVTYAIFVKFANFYRASL